MASLLEKMRGMGLSDLHTEMADMVQEIVSDDVPSIQLDGDLDEETRAEIEQAIADFNEEGPENLEEYTEEELASIREASDRSLEAIRERAMQAGRERFRQNFQSEPVDMSEPVADYDLEDPEGSGMVDVSIDQHTDFQEDPEFTPAIPDALDTINQQGTALAGDFIRAMEIGDLSRAMHLSGQLGALRDQGDALALSRLAQALQVEPPTQPTYEDVEAARYDADALAITPEDEISFQMPQAPGMSPEEADALIDAAEIEAGQQLTDAQNQAAETFSTSTLIFDIYVKGCVFSRRVPAERVIKGDRERAEEAAREAAEEAARLALEAETQPALPLDAATAGEAPEQPEQTEEGRREAQAKQTKLARKKLISVNKKMLEGPELDAIVDSVRQFKKFVELRSMPCEILKGGKFVIPTCFVADIETRYQQFRKDRKDAIKAFLLAYDRLKQEARARFVEADLLSLYDETQYPLDEELPKMFSIAHSWTAFDAPKALQSIKAGLWEDADRQIKITLAEAANEARDALRASFAEYAGWLVERLTDGGDESKRKKGINANKVAQLQEFLSTVDGLNITKDQDLTNLVTQARNAVEGLDVKALREDGAARERVRAAFEGLQTASAGWIVDKSRAITFDEEAV